MATTQLTPSALPGRPYGDFTGKEFTADGPHNPGTITQLTPMAIPGRRYGSFDGKEPSDAVVGRRRQTIGLFLSLPPRSR